MSVSHDDVRRIAALARLGVDESRLSTIAAQLNTILGHMDVLREVDTLGVPPVTGVGVTAQPLREDGGPPYPLDRPLARFAPAMREGFIIVPRLGTHDGSAESGA